MNNLEEQFRTLPLKRASEDMSSLENIEASLRMRAAYAIYNTVVRNMMKRKDEFSLKAMNNEIFY